MRLSDAWRDPEIEAWHAGRLTAQQLADALLPFMLAPADEEGVSHREALGQMWSHLSDELAATGFQAEDFSTLLESLVPQLPSSAFGPALGQDFDLPDRSPRRPAGRVYIDVDGAFSPFCLQRDESPSIPWMKGPRVAVEEPPCTGWTWHMTTLASG